jgi:hypothetical protein
MSDRYQATPSGVLVPTPPEDTSWALAFMVGEVIPLKGAWFRVAHINTEAPHGIALYRLKPTARAMRRAAVKKRREDLQLTTHEGGRA